MVTLDLRSMRCLANRAAAFALTFALLLTSACSTGPRGLPEAASAAPAQPTAMASPSTSQVDVPDDAMPPATRCMVERGFRVTKVRPPAVAGDSPGYELVFDGPPADAQAIFSECSKLREYRPKSESELREIYSRWRDERTCLVKLGYTPAEPPSVEKFVADWQTGPWMPIDGVDTARWTDAQYQVAKEACTLEMFDRE